MLSSLKTQGGVNTPSGGMPTRTFVVLLLTVGVTCYFDGVPVV